jgi:hypothetical protein
MIGARWRRLVATLTGAWMLVMVTSPMALWSCPAHGTQQSAMSHHMDMGHSGDHTPAHSKDCCGGCCCSVAAVGLTPGRLVSLPVVPVAIVAEAPAPALGAPRASTPHLRLPLPLGPPAIRV